MSGHNRKPAIAPAGLTKLTKATLTDLLWWFVGPLGAIGPHATEEPGWIAIEHAAKQLTLPNADRLTLRTLIRIRRKRALR